MRPLPVLLTSILLTSVPATDLQAAEQVTEAGVRNVWVQVVPPRRGVLRAITEGARCPAAHFDGQRIPMQERARPSSDYDVLVCELVVPPAVERIEVAGRSLRNVTSKPQRVAVVGDTGCRMKAGHSLDDGFQNCGDPDDWEFAKVARQVAAWKPDLIIQVGDYIYREHECPEGCGNCAGSPFNGPGMRMATWNAEFFDPGKPMLEAAPIVFVRGDHEKCERAGSGYFRFLDGSPLQPCTDFSDPYALDFEGLQLVVMDTVQAEGTSLSPELVVDRYARDFEQAAKLATGNTWLVSHRPIWALRPAPAAGAATTTDACDNQTIPDELIVQDLSVTVQHALARSTLEGRLPDEVDLVLTGHIHLGEVLSFTGRRPPQMVVGISGTKLLPSVSTDLVGKEIAGERITHALLLSAHGFFGFDPQPHDVWRADVRDVAGASLATCKVGDKVASCQEPKTAP